MLKNMENEMQDMFVPYEIAKKAKEKGFKKPCMAKYMLDMKGDVVPHFRYNYESEGLFYNHNGRDLSGLNGNSGKDFLWSAPLYQQVIEWLKCTHKIYIYDYPYPYEDRVACKVDFKDETGAWCSVELESKEQAIEEALNLI